MRNGSTHPVGTYRCLIWNLFGSVFYAFYFSIPLFFNSSGRLVNPQCTWQISEPRDIVLSASLCLGREQGPSGGLCGRDVHLLSQILSYNCTVPLIKVCSSSWRCSGFHPCIMRAELGTWWSLQEAHLSILGQCSVTNCLVCNEGIVTSRSWLISRRIEWNAKENRVFLPKLTICSRR